MKCSHTEGVELLLKIQEAMHLFAVGSQAVEFASDSGTGIRKALVPLDAWSDLGEPETITLTVEPVNETHEA
jgi:hypothetical protein